MLAAFGNIETFNSGLTASDPIAGATTGIGATHHCDLTVPGASIEERIVDWADGQSYRAEIYDGVRNPFATAFATPSVNPLAEGHGSTVRMSTEWKAKGGVLGALLDRGLRAQNRKAITGVLAGLKHHVVHWRAAWSQRIARRHPILIVRRSGFWKRASRNSGSSADGNAHKRRSEPWQPIQRRRRIPSAYQQMRRGPGIG